MHMGTPIFQIRKLHGIFQQSCNFSFDIYYTSSTCDL
jgi:hypothetical protein